jgi:cytochrome c oxidase subunit 2
MALAGRRRSAPLGAALLLAVVGSLLAASGASADIFSPEDGGSPNADRIDTLYKLVAFLGLLVFLAVEGMLIWSMVKFKARKGRKAAQIHGNTKLEIGWTVAAAVILVFVTAVTFIQLGGIVDPDRSDIDANGQPTANAQGTLLAATNQSRPPAGDSLKIRVDGQQYLWRYQYPGPKRVYAYVEMVVPVGRTVTLDITADDVAHSWWIPQLGGKADALPGYLNKSWFKATKPGIYKGQCAELCGRNHANMLATVRAVPFDEYQRWYNERAEGIQVNQDEGAKQRDALNRAEAGEAPAGE